ncbi:MAG: DUF4334 domain-containing protein [Flavobacteriales bacterium]
MNTINKKGLYAINPFLIPLGRRLPKTKLLRLAMALLKPILKTNNSKACMRMIKYRCKIKGTMIYDQKGIKDHFAKIEENTMLWAMDIEGAKTPYFFVLERDSKNKTIRV